MNNLTTRKIVLGLLMTLVLVFSVQGIADALALAKPTSNGDLSTIAVDSDTFTIMVTVDLEAREEKYVDVTEGTGDDIAYADGTNQRAAPNRIGSSSAVTEDISYGKGDTHYYVTTSIAQVDRVNADGDKTGTKIAETTSTRTWVTESDAYYHNDESVTIEIPSGITLTTQGGGTDDVTFKELLASDDPLKLEPQNDGIVTIEIEGYASTTGKKTITIKDATPSADRDGDDAAKSLTYTIYVTRIRGHSKSSYDIPSTASINLNRGGVTNGVGVGYFGRGPVLIYNGDNNHYPVEYTVTGVGATIYVQETPDRTTPKNDTPVSTSSAAKVYLNIDSVTAIVTAEVDGAAESSSTTAVYIYGYPKLAITELTKLDSEGPAGTEIMGITATVTDGAVDETPVGDVPVKFEIVNQSTGALLTKTTGTVVDRSNNVQEDLRESGATLHIRTEDSGGTAVVKYEIGTAGGEQIIRVSAVGDTKEVKITNTSISARQLSVRSEKHQTGGKFDIIATVTQNEIGIGSVEVTFTTVDGGELTGTPHGSDDTTEIVKDTTNAEGEAIAIYDPGTTTGDLQILVSIPDQGTVENVVSTAKTIRKSFFVRGGGRSDPPPRNVILITLSSTTGEPGEEIDVRVTSDPSGESVNINSGELSDSDFSGLSGTTPFTRTLILPDEEGEYTFSATRSRFTSDSATVTVEAELGTLSITAIGSPEAGLQTFSIRALDADGDRASAPFTARLSGTGFTSRNVEIADGRGNARVTLPTAARLYTLTVSADGYIDGSTPVRITADGQVDDTDDDTDDDPVPPPPEDTGGEPDSIEITGPSTRSGTVNEELDTPLLVRVLDDDGDGLEGARVFYRVISGRGRLSARGNGRAIGVVTDSSGYARAVFTPLDGGTITVRANTDDLSATVEFTITTGSAPGTRDAGTGVTPGASTTPGTISPVVHVAAASRPPMLWVDGGAIYALVGASPQRFAPSVDNALNITVAGGKVYWTEKTGESGGTINSANLNGSGVTELASIFATPMGIAVDVTNSKLYWTNSAGRIQSANLDGSRITNELQNLASPMDIALAGGNAYWTQGGNVRFVNLRGQKVVRNVSTGMDTAGSLAIGGGKVYWTETTGESGGTVNSANLNGTGATQLASILAAPIGIAVDGSRSKLYWSNSRGRIQSANLDGSGIKNVVSGLGSPGELVLSNSIAMPTAAATTTTTTTASNAKYDVNSDGLVDNTDAGLVADAMGTSNARYDVNGDGTVNFLDLLLVFDNRDAGAAGAPTVVGMKLSAAQIDIIEEQIDLLIATNDRSPSAMRVLVYLQQLLVTARPEKTQLLTNYPNPFNPETWIPYELATDTNVRLTIYNTQGVVIRSLQFGHQSAGYYTGRDRAAYWDGRNALGEQVASGLYFYQLETDEMSLMRKMVILK